MSLISPSFEGPLIELKEISSTDYGDSGSFNNFSRTNTSKNYHTCGNDQSRYGQNHNFRRIFSAFLATCFVVIALLVIFVCFESLQRALKKEQHTEEALENG
uniref:Uncharacterized protein n=1 Tax=Guillardia theta TaxID=55529 RepID=A0A7S4P2T9_GUITH|mmetsp:Transcript_4196/g.15463  ORF Transcript_4196/g.15463 Transcript_4196/m.15463 type:complete len:102 (+) Transcript_4196:93-398(+)